MDQLVYMPWFLSKYQEWWASPRTTVVADLDFTILILRICSYTLRFLPAPGYTLDKIRGVLLADARIMCDEAADSLDTISAAADGKGSLIRVQHLAFFGLQCQIEGKTAAFWEILSRTIRVAQDVGMRNGTARWRQRRQPTYTAGLEMERRTFCNLFI